MTSSVRSSVRCPQHSKLCGRAVGSRVLRDALLDHVPIVVETDEGERFHVPQRLVQAVTRMGFVPAAPAGDRGVEVRAGGPWVGLAAPFGSAWYRPPLLLR